MDGMYADYNRLCQQLFTRASPLDRTVSSRSFTYQGPQDPDWISSPVFDEGGSWIAPHNFRAWVSGEGPRLGPKRLRNWLLLTSEARLAQWIGTVLDDLFRHRLPFDSLAGWYRQRSAVFEHVLYQFLRPTGTAAALVWATPLWFLNTNPLPSGSAVKDAPLIPHQGLGSSRKRLPMVDLACGKARTLRVRPGLLTFFSHPEHKQRNGTKREVVFLPRVRIISVPGQQILGVREDAIFLGYPGGWHDEALLLAGKVPVHWDFFERRGPTAPPYLRSCTITIAILQPTDLSFSWVTVDSVVMFFHRGDGSILELSTSTGRNFVNFVQQHPGLLAVLKSRLAGGV